MRWDLCKGSAGKGASYGAGSGGPLVDSYVVSCLGAAWPGDVAALQRLCVAPAGAITRSRPETNCMPLLVRHCK